MNRRLRSPFRYPGGKGKHAAKIVASMGDTSERTTLVEPFVGGGAITLALHDRFESLVVSDRDYAIAAFWRCLADRSLTEELTARIRSTQPTAQERDHQRDIYLSEAPAIVDAAFAALYLNRTGFSGILVGGALSAIGCRWNPVDLANRVLTAHRLIGPRLIVHNADFQTILSRYDLPACVIYCDPPYYAKGDRLYREKMTPFDHTRLAAALARMEHGGWLLSYDDAPEIRALYSGWANVTETVFGYSLTGAGRAKTELIISPRADHRPAAVAEVAA